MVDKVTTINRDIINKDIRLQVHHPLHLQLLHLTIRHHNIPNKTRIHKGSIRVRAHQDIPAAATVTQMHIHSLPQINTHNLPARIRMEAISNRVTTTCRPTTKHTLLRTVTGRTLVIPHTISILLHPHTNNRLHMEVTVTNSSSHIPQIRQNVPLHLQLAKRNRSQISSKAQMEQSASAVQSFPLTMPSQRRWWSRSGSMASMCSMTRQSAPCVFTRWRT
mmetsp:Transcript_3744/g.4186  ORF Transcript_3744/g.4186 Transcript_3744/m.4186 type:complete len:220 (+) Transcript_3744:175-834(+)